MVFNSYTFIAFFIIMLILHNLPFQLDSKKGKSVVSQLYFLCCVESSFHFVAVAFYGGRLFRRPCIVHSGEQVQKKNAACHKPHWQLRHALLF